MASFKCLQFVFVFWHGEHYSEQVYLLALMPRCQVIGSSLNLRCIPCMLFSCLDSSQRRPHLVELSIS